MNDIRFNQLNETHDSSTRSWVESANAETSDFPIQNLPFAIFRRAGTEEKFRGGVAIGDMVLDLHELSNSGLLAGRAEAAATAAAGEKLNTLMEMGCDAWSALRAALFSILHVNSTVKEHVRDLLIPMDAAEFDVAAEVGDYTDFYTSIHHATNVGHLFRPDNPLVPHYKWLPIGYHGRASSIGISGETIERPQGQTREFSEQPVPILGPSRRLDFELELGAFVGPGNRRGDPITLERAEQHVFGLCLLNDWSARDIQSWEYQPLGPFMSKNFAVTISPWIVTLEALAPFRVASGRSSDDHPPLPYLNDVTDRNAGGIDLHLEVRLQTARMRAAGERSTKISDTNYRHAYWTLGQMIAHHTVNGCNLRPGDLLGTGTLSGPSRDQAAALIELTEGGLRPLTLTEEETRSWLEDGDSVVLRGWCESATHRRIGFGECVGNISPARSR